MDNRCVMLIGRALLVRIVLRSWDITISDDVRDCYVCLMYILTGWLCGEHVSM